MKTKKNLFRICCSRVCNIIIYSNVVTYTQDYNNNKNSNIFNDDDEIPSHISTLRKFHCTSNATYETALFQMK